MKANYIVNKTYFSKRTNFILVCNYHFINEVANFIYTEMPIKDKNNVGVWKIKRKN